MDLLVRVLGCIVQGSDERHAIAPPGLGASAKPVEYQIGRHPAGDFAGCGTAHSVCDHEEQSSRADGQAVRDARVDRRPLREVGDEKRVFIVLARTSRIRLAADVYADEVRMRRRGGAASE